MMEIFRKKQINAVKDEIKILKCTGHEYILDHSWDVSGDSKTEGVYCKLCGYRTFLSKDELIDCELEIANEKVKVLRERKAMISKGGSK
jgi:hypothetical protein